MLSTIHSELALLALKRFPLSKDPSLRAWNAADEYLLSELDQRIDKDKAVHSIMIINDQFGALNCGIELLGPKVNLAKIIKLNWTDSLLSQIAIEQNLTNTKDQISNNNIKVNKIWPHLSLQACDNELQLTMDSIEFASALPPQVVLIRIPKHLSLLELQLQMLSQIIDQQTLVLAGGMTKEIHNSTIQLFERYLGQVKTTLARKKARLIVTDLSQFDESKSSNKETSDILARVSIPASISLPPSPQYTAKNEGTNNIHTNKNIEIIGLPGVFCRKELDIGSQVLLNELPELKPGRWLDLGCGTGVIGCHLQALYPQSSLLFCDESELAVISARLSYEQNFPEKMAEFVQSNHLQQVEGNFDVIFCNPPFHQQNTQTLDIAHQMIHAAAKRLNDGGQLFLVANRHLKYQPYMRKFFSKVQPISKNPKFILWQAIK